MVLGHNGHWHRLNFASQFTLTCQLAVLDLCCVLRRQCSSLRHLHLHICYKIYDVPRNLACYDSASDAVFISGNLPYGVCNHRQHGDLCLCAILGTVGHNLGVDYVVD